MGLDHIYLPWQIIEEEKLTKCLKVRLENQQAGMVGLEEKCMTLLAHFAELQQKYHSNLLQENQFDVGIVWTKSSKERPPRKRFL